MSKRQKMPHFSAVVTITLVLILLTSCGSSASNDVGDKKSTNTPQATVDASRKPQPSVVSTPEPLAGSSAIPEMYDIEAYMERINRVDVFNWGPMKAAKKEELVNDICFVWRTMGEDPKAIPDTKALIKGIDKMMSNSEDGDQFTVMECACECAGFDCSVYMDLGFM